MQKFKKILLSLHGENKQMLRWLYVDRQIYIESVSSSQQPIEDEKFFSYHNLSFRFEGTGLRHPERMNLFVSIPFRFLNPEDTSETLSEPESLPANSFQPENFSATFSGQEDSSANSSCVPYEDYLLRVLSPVINGLSQEMENDRKDSREKAKFECQTTGPCILRRSGLIFDAEKQVFLLRILFQMPLINGTSVNAKSGFRAIREILDAMILALQKFDREALKTHLCVYRRQTEILQWLLSHHKTAFVANGSILPRKSDSVLPLENAIPFTAPSDLQATLTLSDGFSITGMAVPEGVTVITGGGYSGKSTLLNALEHGIYHHIPNDGREYVISLPNSMKIYAEDGRPVHTMDLSLFFKEQKNGPSFAQFSTSHASGSVSQAANILEAVYAGCPLLLIDEDTSATNFMIRDSLIRRLVAKEPIIPFTDRVCALYAQKEISTILVIGGSGEYLQHADICLLMEDYRIRNVTKLAGELVNQTAAPTLPKQEYQTVSQADEITLPPSDSEQPKSLPLLCHRYLHRPKDQQPFSVSQYVSVDHAHYIQINDCTCDVTRLTAFISENQFQTLAYLLERCLSSHTDSAGDTGEPEECLALAGHLAKLLFQPEIITKTQTDNFQFTLWLEEIRPIDVLAGLFRMRGIDISHHKTPETLCKTPADANP